MEQYTAEFDEQAAMLQDTNCVYREAVYDKQLVASWVPDPDKPIVPPIILDRVVAVPCEGDPGTVVASGPADATAAGEADRADADLEAARQARVINALDPDVQDFNENDGSLQVASLRRQLEDLQNASRRSVAAELESDLENGAGLIDEAGRERTLQLCNDLKNICQKLSPHDADSKLQPELQRAALGHLPTDLGKLANLRVPRDGAIHETYIATSIGGGRDADYDDDYLESGESGVCLQSVDPPPFIISVIG
ncbi:MAG: hypothetical protein MK077_00725 [Phycisphaerales bacterium]|nr:hypothetical protein [Phycisphaerales bacterium]